LTHLGSGAINVAGGPAALDAISDLDRAINSAEAFQHRYEETGNVDDIIQAISHYETAVAFTAGLNVFHAISNNLGILYLSRFKHTGDLQDVDRAISHQQNAVHSPDGHADLPNWFNNLGNSYLCRFEHTGDFQDIEHALSHHQNAVQSTPSGHAELRQRLNNHGSSYYHTLNALVTSRILSMLYPITRMLSNLLLLAMLTFQLC
jgi:tetratricopeptide (TPR) repeat protein